MLVAAVVLAGTAQADSSEPPPDASEILARYEPVAAAAEAYHAATVSPGGWRTTYAFKVGDEVPEGVEPANAQLRQRTVDGVGVMELTTDGSGFARIGEQFSGPMIVEMEARSVSDRQCDLSLFLDGITHGPGFQFGAHWNTRNMVWTGPQAGSPAFDSVDLPGETRITPNRWHTVRMAIHRDPEPRIVASVDGQVQGAIPLAADYNWAEPRRPMIYAYNSTIQVRRLTVYQPGQPEGSTDAESGDAWRKHFGDRTRDDVAEAAKALIAALDHDRYAVREQAQHMLGRMRTLALAPMRRAWPEASPEHRWRLASLLNRMGVRVEPLTPPESDSDEP